MLHFCTPWKRQKTTASNYEPFNFNQLQTSKDQTCYSIKYVRKLFDHINVILSLFVAHHFYSKKKLRPPRFTRLFCDISKNVMNSYPADIYFSKVSNGNTRKMYEKLTVKIKNKDNIFVAKFERILHIADFGQVNDDWVETSITPSDALQSSAKKNLDLNILVILGLEKLS